MNGLRERVELGAALLDERRGPGWAREVDVDSIDVGNGILCPLGQLYGNYLAGKFELFGFDGAAASRAHGFTASSKDGFGLLEELTAEWKALLAERLHAA